MEYFEYFSDSNSSFFIFSRWRLLIKAVRIGEIIEASATITAIVIVKSNFNIFTSLSLDKEIITLKGLIKMNEILSIATENIAMEMARQRVTQTKVAKKIGITQSAISDVITDISGDRNPSFKTIYLIWVEGLNKDPQDLLKRR